jgi:hypothetical protein
LGGPLQRQLSGNEGSLFFFGKVHEFAEFMARFAEFKPEALAQFQVLFQTFV